ncbi:MAG: UbiA family prenyltransferase, partial [Candidatus Thermoplasmatota archaeon]|nr:UbiA family prenyltransferase [Candidatus Thermoplasmatota archaeon]
FYLFLLLLIGFFGHTFGFVFNDIVDYHIDKSSTEISDRPLLSKTISIRNAWVFAILSMIAAFVFAFLFAYLTNHYFPIIILVFSASFITLYDLTSKKFPFTDIFVAIGIFLLILYGSFYGATPAQDFSDISTLAWIVCILGSIQVLFMQIVAGGMKDIENDFKRGAHTLAIKIGVRVTNGTVHVSSAFQGFAYFIQLLDLIMVFLPFVIIPIFQVLIPLRYFQWIVLLIIGILMFFISHRLLSMKTFDRMRARRLIGSHYMINFMLVPIMLMALTPWAGLLVFFPALGFILSNLILHGTVLQPKTM